MACRPREQAICFELSCFALSLDPSGHGPPDRRFTRPVQTELSSARGASFLQRRGALFPGVSAGAFAWLALCFLPGFTPPVGSALSHRGPPRSLQCSTSPRIYKCRTSATLSVAQSGRRKGGSNTYSTQSPMTREVLTRRLRAKVISPTALVPAMQEALSPRMPRHMNHRKEGSSHCFAFWEDGTAWAHPTSPPRLPAAVSGPCGPGLRQTSEVGHGQRAEQPLSLGKVRGAVVGATGTSLQ